MDTKWNSTDKNPAETPKQFVSDQVQETPGSAEPADCVIRVDSGSERTRCVKSVIAFLAFVLAISLILGSLGAVAGRMLAQRGGAEWWKSDWQETESFRAEVSDYLRQFLSLGAGERLSWYDTEVVQEAYGGTLVTGVTVVQEPSVEVPAVDEDNPDAPYKYDKSVLYRVRKQGSAYSPSEWYSNTDGAELSRNLPEGYNFLLTFANGKVTILKDGVDLDVYGDGIYDGDSDWFVPGYENFPAGAGVENVTVYMAVRETPLQYFTRNGGVQSSRMYWVYESFQEAREFYFRQAVLLGAGVLLLLLWLVLRREKKLADRKIASWTAHVWTEPRFLAVAACLLWLTVGTPYLSELVWCLRYEYFETWNYWASLAGRYLLCLPFSNIPALLGLVWVLWLIHNDHRYNPKEQRKSLLKELFRALRVRDLKRPVQKRIQRRAWAGPIGVAVMAAAVPVSICVWQLIYWHFTAMFILTLCMVFLLLMLWLVLSARQSMALARDIGLLADQVEAIRSGDLSTPLDLPEDADLRQTAESLNGIQAGLYKALEEQTRSERMKVELVSNVSHDLKTPLTSILSYAELLRQEPLEGAAADYARIIDEKAQRLKSMVQDVFEVSKAAADQLPVHMERLDLAKLLRQTLADMDDPIRASRLTFKTGLPDQPVEIVADGKRLYRVFQNLIQNALQYALDGSRVYLSLKTGEGRAEASLRNTSRSELPAGVDFTARFVRGDESRTDGGSGLGLSIASSFTEACGGEFRVETVADLFTAVVTFPLAEG